jgi:peptidoglycan/xylan/chitin deacetylase (PgdA/CDA1 family)
MGFDAPSVCGAAALAAMGASTRWNWWRRPQKGLPILMYHKIGIPPAGSKLGKLWVSPRKFKAQLAYLVGHGYQSLTFSEIKNLVENGTPVPSNGVVITFDDGYQNNYTQAFPLMREMGLRGVIFLVVQTVGWDNNWHDPAMETRIPMLTWTQVEEMKKMGFEFGSHTMTHKNLENLEIKHATEEITKSRRVLGEFLGAEPVSFAYPYGAGQDNARLRDKVKEAGYTFGIGIHQGKADLTQDLYRLRRLFVRGDDTMLDFYLNMTRGKARF